MTPSRHVVLLATLVALAAIVKPAEAQAETCTAGYYWNGAECENCGGCGGYQDEAGQTECKTATVATCPENSVPAWNYGWSAVTSLEDACEEVAAGYFYTDQTGTSSSTCYPIEECTGCGAYQDEAGQTTCKTATVETCPENNVPKYNSWSAVTSLADACDEVSAGYFYTYQTGASSSTCYPIEKCTGCGAYQDEAGQTTCKTATVETCPTNYVPSWSSYTASLEAACKEVPAGSYYENLAGDSSSTCYDVNTCTGCGAYQDEPGQTTCKTASKEDCPANHVPSETSYVGAASLEDVCELVDVGYYYTDTLASCYEINSCTGCGAYQNEIGQTECKTATVASCPANSVPSYATTYTRAGSLEEICEEVPVGHFYENTAGDSSSTCFPIEGCEGCGAYQDEAGQTTCKTATLETCPSAHVPVYASSYSPSGSLDEACAAVNPGNFYENTNGSSSSTCYPIDSCAGCGAYQDEAGQTSCKEATVATCPDNHVPDRIYSFSDPATSMNEACKSVPAGSVYDDDYSSCYPVSRCYGCGVYQDERMQTECKVADMALCGEQRVPASTSSISDGATTLDDACKDVPLGYIFEDDDSSYNCYPVEACAGCGQYQDQVMQTECKLATKAACGAARVPKDNAEATTSLEDACEEVPAGSFYTDDEGACFPVAECAGCGLYQDEAGQTSCKTAECGAESVPMYHAGSTAPECQALPVPAGSFLNGGCAYTCTGCGSYQDEENASSCNIATKDDCPEGQYPVLARGAASLAEVCVAAPAGQGFEEDLCAFNDCFADETTFVFTCKVLRDAGFSDCSHAVMTASEWTSVSAGVSEETAICFLEDEVVGECDCANPPTSAPTQDNNAASSQKSGLGETATVAISSVAVVLGIVAIAGAFFVWRRSYYGGRRDSVDSESVLSAKMDMLR